MLELNLATRRAVLAGMIAVGGVYETVIVHLYQEPHTAAPGDDLAALDAIEADFPGYAVSATLVWGTIFDTADGAANTLSQLVQFDCTGDTDPQDIYGYYLEAGAALVGQEALPTPLPARQEFDAIPILPRLSFSQ